jgi:hypothetical protein
MIGINHDEDWSDVANTLTNKLMNRGFEFCHNAFSLDPRSSSPFFQYLRTDILACGYYKPYAIALELRSYVKGYGLGRGRVRRGGSGGGSGRDAGRSSSSSSRSSSGSGSSGSDSSTLESYWSYFSYNPQKQEVAKADTGDNTPTNNTDLALFDSKVPMSTPEFENYRYGYVFKLSPQLAYASCAGPEQRLLGRVSGQQASEFLQAVSNGDAGRNMTNLSNLKSLLSETIRNSCNMSQFIIIPPCLSAL